MTRFPKTLLLASLFMNQAVMAQVKEVPEVTRNRTIKIQRAPSTQIAIVAVGPKPQRRFFSKDLGGEPPLMRPPEEGEVPPSRLYYQEEASTGAKADWQVFDVPFNNPAAMREIRPEKTLTLYRRNKKTGAYKKYVTIPPGERGSRRVFFLIPVEISNKPWRENPIVRSINLNAEQFQEKQFILKNLSSFPVRHTFDSSSRTVHPTQTIAYKRSKKGHLHRVKAHYSKHEKVIYNTAVRIREEEAIHFFALYNANSKTNSGNAIGVFRMMISGSGNDDGVSGTDGK